MALFSTGMFGAKPQLDPNDPMAALQALGIQPQQGMGTFQSPMQPGMSAAASAPPPMGSAFDPSNSPAGPTALGGLQGGSLPPIAPSKPSFFGQGGAGRGIAGTIGDYLLQQAHMQPVFAPAQQQQRAAQLAQQQRQQQLQDSRNTWLGQQQFKLEHPDPGSTQQEITDLRANGATDTDIKNLVASKTQGTPFVYDQYNPATGQTEKVITTRSAFAGGPAAPSGPPDAAVQYLRQNPHFAQDFDAKYGLGSAAKVLNGGATPSASGTFPR